MAKEVEILLCPPAWMPVFFNPQPTDCMHSDSAMNPDTIDQRILYCLQENSQLSNQQLAERVALSPSACLRRVRALEESGLIRGYRAVLDAKKLGFELEAIVHVSLDQTRPNWHEQFIDSLAAHDEITQVCIVTGSCNYILTVRTRNLTSFSQLVEQTLIKLPGVRDLRSHIVLRKTKDRGTMLPLSGAGNPSLAT